MRQTRHITHGLFPLLSVPVNGRPLFRLIVQLLLAKLAFIVIGSCGTRTEIVIAQLQVDAEPHAAVRDRPAQLGQIKCILQDFLDIKSTGNDADEEGVDCPREAKWGTCRAHQAFLTSQYLPCTYSRVSQTAFISFLNEPHAFHCGLVHFDYAKLYFFCKLSFSHQLLDCMLETEPF